MDEDKSETSKTSETSETSKTLHQSLRLPAQAGSDAGQASETSELEEASNANGGDCHAPCGGARNDGEGVASLRMTELAMKCEEYLNGWKRAQADYQNLVKEFDQRRIDYVKFSNANLIIELLPILDNFKAAFSQIPEAEKNSPWVVGFQYIKKQLEDFLAKEGVEQIKTVGEEFNHELHEAVDNGVDLTVEAPFDAAQGDKRDDGNDDAPFDAAQGDNNEDSKFKLVVVKEVRSGYMLNKKVVQVAKVVVDNIG